MYANPGAVIAISIIFPVLGIIAVSLRFYSRARTQTRIWIDDYLTIPALMLEIIMAGLMIWGASSKSLGDLLPPPDFPGPMGYLKSDSAQQVRLQKIQYYVDWIGVFAFGLLKLSILFFYRKIFCSTGLNRDAFDYATMIMIILVCAWTLTFGIGGILLCGAHPTNAWAPVIVVAEKCSAQLPFLEGYAISDFIMDVLIWFLPIPRILALRMTVQRKIAVIAVFFVGILTIAASATRMGIYIKYVVNAFAQSDGETLITYLLFWTMVEVGLGVIVVCMPTVRSLYGKTSFGSIVSGIKGYLTWRSVQSGQSGSFTEPGRSMGSNSNAAGVRLKSLGSRSNSGDAHQDLEKQRLPSSHPDVDRKYSLPPEMDDGEYVEEAVVDHKTASRFEPV